MRVAYCDDIQVIGILGPGHLDARHRAADTHDAEWCEDADLAVPMHPYPAPGGLLPWSSSSQEDFFLWTTSPAGRKIDPGRHHVHAEARGHLLAVGPGPRAP
ncbi:hypothetical protein [Streptomyces sp. NPDC006333]|uniref:hypothetical protein n=1 Tax=Streptomyces sp. NPDC006333 TaxID=3156753 RepID=UPI0033A1679A